MAESELQFVSEAEEILKEQKNLSCVVSLASAILAVAGARGIELDKEKVCFTVNQDTLNRPEISLGYSVAENNIVHSPIFVVYKEGVIRAYRGKGELNEFLQKIAEFISDIEQSRK